jgi:hypothetical protein
MDDRRATDLDTVIATVLGTVKAGQVLPRAVVLPHGASGNQLSWLPWYMTDFYGNAMVEAMSDRQQNRYRRLLDKSWQLDPACFLPADLDLLASMCRCTPLDFQQDKAVILARFKCTEDGAHYYNVRLLREYLAAIAPYMKRLWAAENTNRQRKRAPVVPITVVGTDNATVNGTDVASGATTTTTTTTTTTVKEGEAAPLSLERDKTPDGLHQLQYAKVLLDDLAIPESRPMLEIVASSISTHAKSASLTKAQAFEYIRGRAMADNDAGVLINNFWFQDRKYLTAKAGQSKKASKGEEYRRQRQAAATGGVE